MCVRLLLALFNLVMPLFVLVVFLFIFKIFENIPEFCSIRLRSKQIEYEIFITRTLNKIKSLPFFNRTDSCCTRFAYFLLDIRNRNECFSPIDTC